jgi:hypothetical protein
MTDHSEFARYWSPARDASDNPGENESDEREG